MPCLSHLSGNSYFCCVPACVIDSVVSVAPDLGYAKPCNMRSRRRCFMFTVSPARSSVRAKIVCTASRGTLKSVLTLKRHVAMPSFQSLCVNDKSSAVRAKTSKMRPRYSHDGIASSRGKLSSMRAMPLLSVIPFQRSLPAQSRTLIAAFAIGLA